MAKPSSPGAMIRVGTASLLVVVAACSGGGAPPDVQVAARVNKGEITIHQVQHVLQRQARLATEFPDTAARRVLDSLIEQELAAQAARAQKLDQDPAVVQAMQAAQREVLARAYQDGLAAKASGPSSDEIDRYYESQPGLFAQRRVYTLQETLVETVDESQQGRIQAIVDQAKSAKELEDRLRQAAMRYRTRQFAQAAEDMPLGMLATMVKLEVGQSMVVPQGNTARIFSILHALPAPMERKMANEAITAFLVAERKRRAVADGMKAVRDTAKIEYLGNFAAAASAPGR
jgi:EpsD family peptidyl-prolyl cis-trans isomerase